MDQLEAETRDGILAGARKLGITPDDILLIHSSFKSLGQTALSPHQIVETFSSSVLPHGTALYPTLTGSAGCSPENPPEFDARTTPCWTGAIPSAALKHPNAVRSLNLTHSVTGIGDRADMICRNHQLAETPCGAGSPFDALIRLGGKVLLIGCDYESVTLLHHVEEIAGVEYHMIPGHSISPAVDWDGVTHTVRQRYHRYGAARAFHKLQPYLERAEAVTTGSILRASCTLIDAQDLAEIALALLRSDPAFLLA